MALSGQGFDEVASDCSKRRIHQLFAANGGDQIRACDRDIRYGGIDNLTSGRSPSFRYQHQTTAAAQLPNALSLRFR